MAKPQRNQNQQVKPLQPEKTAQQRAANVTITTEISGPLPPPEVLAHYNQIEQGLALRIVQMAENEATHRRQCEQAALQTDIGIAKAQTRETALGQILAFIIAMTAIVGGMLTAINGAEWAGTFIGVGGLAGLVGAFIQGRNHKS
jgi:uncharacterized membrane protein